MAYMNQELKAKLAVNIKSVLKKYNVKATISTGHHSISVNIRESSLDFIGNYVETVSQRPGGFRFEDKPQNYLCVNPYWYKEHFSGTVLDFLNELFVALNEGNHDNSDIMTDYFDVGWYVHVNVGKWNKPYNYIIPEMKLQTKFINNDYDNGAELRNHFC